MNNTKKMLKEKVYFIHEDTKYRTEPSDGYYKGFVKLKDGEKELPSGHLGLLEAERFGDEISKEEYSK